MNKYKTIKNNLGFAHHVLLGVLVVSIIVLAGAKALTGTYASRPVHSNFAWGPVFSQLASSMDTAQPPDGHFPWNTTGCSWNDEDQLVRGASGTLSGTTSDTMCMVADIAGGEGAYPKSIIYKIESSQPNLNVTLSNDAGDSWTSLAPKNSNGQYLYQLCVNDPVSLRKGVQNASLPNGLLVWPVIPNTNNGYGQIVHYTLSVNAPKTDHKFSGEWEVGLYGGSSNTFLPPFIQGNSPVPCPPN